MILALVRKELRELLPLILLALLAQLVVASSAMGIRLGIINQPDQMIPFVAGDIISYAVVVAAILAVVAGLRQTMWESRTGTFQFLLHRPARRETILATKLAVGAGACVLVLALPLVCYAVWAATPGTHASPFYWSMTAWAWQVCFELPFLYLGAFVSGLRPARWYGSRFIPLTGSAVLLMVLLLLGLEFSVGFATVVMAVVVDAALVVAILYVARFRDFS